MSLHRVSSLLAALFGVLVLAGPASAAPAAKVTICHFPPDAPGNFQTITITPSALPAHLAHHDFGGPCENDCALFGSLCDDGNACTGPVDRCDGAGQCRGTSIAGCCTADAACDDQNPCTDDTCDLATHTCTNGTKTCTASDLCHQASCAPDDGTCVEAPIECAAGESCSADTGQCVTGCPCLALLPEGTQLEAGGGSADGGSCPDGSSFYGGSTIYRSTDIELTVTESHNADCMGTDSYSCNVTGHPSLPLTVEQYLTCQDALRG